MGPMLASGLYVCTLFTKAMVCSAFLVFPDIYFLFQDLAWVTFSHVTLSVLV